MIYIVVVVQQGLSIRCDGGSAGLALSGYLVRLQQHSNKCFVLAVTLARLYLNESNL